MIEYGIYLVYLLLKKIKIIYKEYKDLINNILIIILYTFGFLLYFLSLRGINGPKMKCFSKIGYDCFYILGEFIFFSALMTDISLHCNYLE